VMISQGYENLFRMHKLIVFFSVLKKYSAAASEIAEAGCGEAFFSLALACSGVKVNALDISAQLIDRLNKLKNEIREIDDYITFEVGDVFLIEGNYDLLFNHGVMEHWEKEDRKKVFQVFYKVIRPGGYLIVAVPNLESKFLNLSLNKKINVPKMYDISRASLINELQDLEFDIVETGSSFVGPGFHQWCNKILIWPILIVKTIYPFLPNRLQSLLAAHVYVVAKKRL
jgi:SAM-dependent methyltransferase